MNDITPDTHNENFGQQLVGNYDLLSNNNLETLTIHGNLLVSASTFERGLRAVAKKKYKRSVRNIFRFNPKTFTPKKLKLYNDCLDELMKECELLSGRKDCYIRILKADPQFTSDLSSIIIESGGKGNGGE